MYGHVYIAIPLVSLDTLGVVILMDTVLVVWSVVTVGDIVADDGTDGGGGVVLTEVDGGGVSIAIDRKQNS